MECTLVRELKPYLHANDGMQAGAPGKKGSLRLGFELDDEGRSILRDWERHAPLIVQQALYFDEEMPQMPCVYMLSSGGPNVDGDRYEQEITVHRNAMAHIATGAATKIAEMHANCSALTQRFTLEAGAYMEFLPEPTIPCRHARYLASTEIVIDPTATLFYAEIYMSGRKYYASGERFEYDLLSVTTEAHRPEGEPLFREKFVIRPHEHSPREVGCMEDYDLFANVVVLTPKTHADRIYETTSAFIDPARRLAAGITRLPNDCGLLYKVLGDESGPVKKQIRAFCSTVRLEIKGKPLPAEFPWR